MKALCGMVSGLLLAAIVLSGCGTDGVVAFSPASDRIAVLVPGERYWYYDLYTIQANGGSPSKIAETVPYGFNVSFSTSGAQVLFATGDPGEGTGTFRNMRICTAGAGGGSQNCKSLDRFDPSNALFPGGFLSFLPNDNYVVMYESDVRVYKPSGDEVTGMGGPAARFFMPSNLYKRKSSTLGYYLRPADQTSICWIVMQDNTLYRYTLQNGSPQQERMVRQVDEEFTHALNYYDLGTTSPDCTKIALRTKYSAGGYQSVCDVQVTDLSAGSTPLVTLVQRASCPTYGSPPPTYAFSPDGSQLVFEKDGAAWIYDFNGGIQHEVEKNAEQVRWYPSP